MSRAEFAKFDGTSPAAKAAMPEKLRAKSDPRPQPERSLRVLLFDEDSDSAAAIRAILFDAIGERAASDWVSDPEVAKALIAKSEHDVYLCVDRPGSNTAASVLRAGVDAGSAAPILMLAPSADAETDRKTLAAGAADYLPLAGLTAPGLERSIRHAIVRSARISKAEREVEGLTGEKTRLNILRDANHRFVENACHDFRSPLTVIKEFASIIAEGLSGDVTEEQAEFLQIILTRVDQLSQMVDGILDASRLESDVIGVKREEQTVASLIEKVRPTLEQRAAAHKVGIEFAVPDELPQVFADAESIGRVIMNLGANAAKFAGENGKIRVWARYDADAHAVTIGVTDSGPGIAPEHVKLIFDRFRQIPNDKKQEKDGFGLGLHIASEFVRVNFGTLTVESKPQQGSTFAFTLPTFDVNHLVPLHFDFLKTSRHSFQNVAIALATTPSGADPTSLGDVERLLNRQLRSYDLLLRVRPGSWLVCVACDEGDIAQISERILAAYSESSRARADRLLPDLRFRPIGTWALASRAEALSDVIHDVYALDSESRASASPEREALA
jgi:hypothetical protein